MSISSIGELTVTLSAWDNGDGTYGGQGQYYYPPTGNTFHLEVEQLCTGYISGQPYVIAVGPVKLQDGTFTQEFGAIAVVEGGEANDKIRVLLFDSFAQAQGYCVSGNPGATVEVIDGEFNIRSK